MPPSRGLTITSNETGQNRQEFQLGSTNGWTDDKTGQVFQANLKQHPHDKFWPYIGLARWYTAAGDRKAAIASRETALKNVPPDQRAPGPASNERSRR